MVFGDYGYLDELRYRLPALDIEVHRDLHNRQIRYRSSYLAIMEISMNFDIDCLRSFLVIADTMSFSRAAETVGRSQSTISQQIAKLETQVGKALLTRRKGRVLELTSEGGKLVQYARKILQLNAE